MAGDYCFDPTRFARRPDHAGCPRHPVGMGTVYQSAGMARMRGEVGEAFARGSTEDGVKLLEDLVRRAPPFYARKAWERLGDLYLGVGDDAQRLRAYRAITGLAAKSGDPELLATHRSRSRALAGALGDRVVGSGVEDIDDDH